MGRLGREEVVASTAIVIVGLHSSGKTTLARRISTESGRIVLEMGDVVRAEAARRHARNLVELAHSLLEAGPRFIVERTLDKAADAGDQGLIIVGPRTEPELIHLQSSLDCLTVGVSTPDSIRRTRWRHRRLSFSDTWEDRERREQSWGTRELVGLCDVVVNGYDWARYAAEQVLALTLPRQEP